MAQATHQAEIREARDDYLEALAGALASGEPRGGHYPEPWGPAPGPAPLWWDDASYIRYQSADPYAWCEGWTDEDWDAFDAAQQARAEGEDAFGWATRRDFLNGQDEDREALEAMLSAPPCDHGLASWLCADPIGHYPVDYR